LHGAAHAGVKADVIFFRRARKRAMLFVRRTR
jgi:hypothetical protein